MFRNAGVPCSVTDNLARAHWEKLVWNIPFNGLGVAGAAGYEAVTGVRPSSGAATWGRQASQNISPTVEGTAIAAPEEGPTPVKAGPCLTTDMLLADPKWEKLVRELMLEVIGTARAVGFAIED